MTRNEVAKIAISYVKKCKNMQDDVIFDEVKFKVDGYSFHAEKRKNSNEFSLYVNGEYIKLASDGTLCRNDGCCLSGCGHCL